MTAQAQNIDNKKPIWILETIQAPLMKMSEAEIAENPASKYTFEGPCAEFNGEKNENERYYDKDDYAQHVEYLKEEIAENSLLGELNHNEEYMVDMTKVSHMVKDLRYDEQAQQYKIKVQLLETRNGKDAMAMVDAGAPLYISSRASGYIDDKGNVTLERIYTYDIVYRPGFKNAKLNRLNESLGFKSESISIFERKQETPINKLSNPNENMSEFVTKKDFQSYSEKVENHLVSLRKLMEGKSAQPLHLRSGKNNFASRRVNESVEDGQLTVDNIKAKLTGQPTEKLEDLYKKYVAPNMPDDSNADSLVHDIASAVLGDEEKMTSIMNEEVMKDAEEPVSTENQPKQDAEFEERFAQVEEAVKNNNIEMSAVLEFLEMARLRFNGQSAFINEMVKFNNTMADFVDKIAVRSNEQGEFMNMISNKMNETIDYVHKTATFAHESHKNTNALRNTVNEVVSSQNKMITTVNESMKQMNKKITDTASSNRTQRYLENRQQRINESKEKTSKNIVGNKGELTSKVDSILESVKKKGTDEKQIIMEHNYPFVKHLDDSTRQIFEGMNEVQRKQVANHIKTNKNVTKENVSDVVNRVNEDKDLTIFLTKMPKKYINVWESLNSVKKEQVISLFRMKECRSDYEVEMFWEGIDFSGSAQLLNENINVENNVVELGKDVSSIGYNESEIDRSLGLN